MPVTDVLDPDNSGIDHVHLDLAEQTTCHLALKHTNQNALDSTSQAYTSIECHFNYAEK